MKNVWICYFIFIALFVCILPYYAAAGKAGVVSPIVSLPSLTEKGFVFVSTRQSHMSGNELLNVKYVDDDNLTGTENGSSQYPYKTIQSALNAAVSGDTIEIAAGSYAENLTVNNKYLFLQGGYPGGSPSDYTGGFGGDFNTHDPNLYASEITASASTPAILIIYSEASGSVIDGFTISGGSHGIEVDDDFTWPLITNVTISNNLIENNGETGNTGHRGGGILLSGDNHLVEGNTIQYNNSGRGAGIYSSGDSVEIRENVIENNVAYDDHAGGLNLAGTVTMTGNIIRSNRSGEGLGYGWGGGVLILGTAYLSSNIFCYNHAPSIGGGVFVDEGGWAELKNELIYGNTTDAFDKGGAAIYVDGGARPSHADIINCTIADNLAPGSSGGNGVYVEGESTAAILNCIFWGNSGDDFYTSPDSSITMNYSLSEEILSGTGNISTDPFFSNSLAQDYHLKSLGGTWDPDSGIWTIFPVHSPAIDTGDPSADLSLEPIPNGSRINLGAFGNTVEASKSVTGQEVPLLSTFGLMLSISLLGGLIHLHSRC